jgi:putative heme-binding domain-containing protein
MANTHGRRINQESIEPRGAGSVSRHVGDPLRIANPWFRGVSLVETPEGDVLISDWCDQGECHDADGVHRTSGRIYRIAARGRAPVARFMEPGGAGLSGRSDLDLVKFQGFEAEWYARGARRVLQERAALGTPTAPEAVARLRHILESHERPGARLRALWTLHALGLATEKDRLRFSRSVVQAHRVWGVRLIAEQEAPSAVEQSRLLEMARTEPSLRVRLELASVVARLPDVFAWSLGQAVARGPAPAAEPPDTAPTAPDHTLELVLWHVLEPHIVTHGREAVALARATPSPKLRRFIIRRLGAALDDEEARAALGQALAAAAASISEPWAQDVLAGAVDGVAGRRGRPSPPRWSTIAEQLIAAGQPQAREAAVALSIAFNDAATLEALRALLRSATAPMPARLQALEGLRQANVPDLPAVLLDALKEPPLRLAALRGVAASADPAPARAALALWPALTASEKSAAVDSLATRPTTARLLLDALARGSVARSDISVSQARQFLALDDADVEDALEAHWGNVTAGREDTGALLDRYRALLTSTAPSPPDLAHGRAVFRAACGACHRLFGEGGALGPDLTGGGRKELDYLLQNVLDPSAAVPRDYKMTVVTLHDGQVLSGVVPAEDASTVTLQTLTDRRVLDRADVKAVEPQPYSWMPEGLFQSLPVFPSRPPRA